MDTLIYRDKCRDFSITGASMSASDPLVTIRYCHIENHTENENLLCNFKPWSLIDYNRFKSKIKGPYRNPLVRLHLHIKLDVHLNQVGQTEEEGSKLEVKYQCFYIR